MDYTKKVFDYLSRPKEMTKGKPSLRLVEFAIPLLIGNFVQQLYNTVDSIIVGKYLGDQALAAIGVTGALVFFLIVVFIGISVGAGILVSQFFGAKDKEKLSKTIGSTIILNFVFSLVLMVGSLFFIKPLLLVIGTPADILDMAYSYMMILCLGILGMSYYNILTGLLRGLGDSLMPLIYLMISSVINIGLDIVFVAHFNMGVGGAALATVISQAFSAVLCFVRIYRMKDVVSLDKSAFVPDFHLMKQLIKLGFPIGVAQGVVSIAAIFVQKLTNTFGTTYIAVSTVVMRVDGFVMLPNFSFGNAMSTFTGQNAGAMKWKRIRKGMIDGLKMGISTSVVLVLIILIFGRAIMSLFTDTQEVIHISYEMMSILGIGYVAFAITQILSGTMRGAGDTKSPMIIAIFSAVFIRVPSSYLLTNLTKSEAMPLGDPRMIYATLTLSWIISCAFTITLFLRGTWAKRAKIGGKIVDISEIFQKEGKEIPKKEE